MDLPPPRTTPWTSPATRHRPLRGDATADVVVVGGGITGLTTAALLARGGTSVRVLEAGTLAQGTTGASTAKISALQGLRYSKLRRVHGERVLAPYAAAQVAARDWVTERVFARGVECDLEQRHAVSYTNDSGRVDDVEAEAHAAHLAGLDVEVLSDDPELPWGIARAVRLGDQLQLDPRAWVADLAAEVAEHEGSAVHEESRVLGFADRGRTAVTAEGRVRAAHVVLATLLPISDRGLFFARAEPDMSYSVAVTVEATRPVGMYLGADQPTRSLRTATLDGREVLLVGGGGHVVGRRTDTDAEHRDLISWADRWFGVTEVLRRWAAHDYQSIDQLPYVGRADRLPGSPWVATGFNKWGMTNGTAAAMTLAAALGGEVPTADRPWDDLFDPRRLEGWSGAREAASLNATVATQMVKGWAAPASSTTAGGPEVGRHVGVPAARMTRPTASSTDEEEPCRLALVCTHLGGIVRWNEAERTWDCPLHGSRFAADGTVVTAPATRALRRLGGGADDRAGASG